MRVCYEINTMPNFLSLLMLTIIVGVTCHPIQRRVYVYLVRGETTVAVESRDQTLHDTRFCD